MKLVDARLMVKKGLAEAMKLVDARLIVRKGLAEAMPTHTNLNS